MVLTQSASQKRAAHDFRGAVAELREAIAQTPQFADAHFALGQALVESGGDRTEAIAEFRRALDINPERSDSHYQIGLLLLAWVGRLRR